MARRILYLNTDLTEAEILALADSNEQDYYKASDTGSLYQGTGTATPPVSAADAVAGEESTEDVASGGVSAVFEDLQTVTATGNQNDWDTSGFTDGPGIYYATNLNLNIKGLVPPSEPLKINSRYIINRSTNRIRIFDQDTGSLAANRISCPNTLNFDIKPGGSVQLLWLPSDGFWSVDFPE